MTASSDPKKSWRPVLVVIETTPDWTSPVARGDRADEHLLLLDRLLVDAHEAAHLDAVHVVLDLLGAAASNVEAARAVHDGALEGRHGADAANREVLEVFGPDDARSADGVLLDDRALVDDVDGAKLPFPT